MDKEFVIQDYEFIIGEYKRYRLIDGLVATSYFQMILEKSHEYIHPINKNERRNAYI